MGSTTIGKPDHVFPHRPEIGVGLGRDLHVAQRHAAHPSLFPDSDHHAPVNVFFIQFQHVHLVAQPEAGLGRARREIGVVLVFLAGDGKREGQVFGQPVRPVPRLPFLEFLFVRFVTFWQIALIAFVQIPAVVVGVAHKSHVEQIAHGLRGSATANCVSRHSASGREESPVVLIAMYYSVPPELCGGHSPR
jgi:hypothetical protein